MDDYFDLENEELLKDFFSEAEQQVETLESNILVLENDPSNSSAVDEVFRAAHTLKGGSATVKMTELSEFTHAVEDLLDEVRSGTISISEEIIDALLSSIDIIKLMLEERANGSVFNGDVAPVKERLHAYATGKPVSGTSSTSKTDTPVPKITPPVPPKASSKEIIIEHPATHLTEYDILELNELCAKGELLWGVTVLFDESNPMNSVGGIQVFTALQKKLTVLKTHPDFDELYKDTFHEKIVYYISTSLDKDSIEDLAFIDDVVIAVDAKTIDENSDKTVVEKFEIGSASIAADDTPSEAIEQVDAEQSIPTSFDHPQTLLAQSEINDMAHMCEKGQKLWGVTVLFDESNPMNSVGAIQCYVALKNNGSLIKTLPDFDSLYEETFHEKVVYYIATTANEDVLETAAFLDDAVLAVEAKCIDSHDNLSLLDSDEPSTSEDDVQVANVSPVAADGQRPVRTATASSASSNTGSVLRVDSKRIDYLLNLVSETVITKAAFNQTLSISNNLQTEIQMLNSSYKESIKKLIDQIPLYSEKIKQGTTVKEIKATINTEFESLFTLFDGVETASKAFDGKFRSYTQNLGRIAGELQEGVMKIRMVPIGQIFSRFPRVVRDLSRDLNKKINLVIEGEETELDKSVVEDLLDPIMHCVRNSVDHGIELPADRINAGKDEDGTVLLKASNEGNMIVIEIKDDGKGIDVDSVRQKAIERGLIHSSKVISDEEAFQFIFDPGFSTAKAITNVSGRGVGLDVVKTQIEKLKGSVVINSEKGIGSTFTIKIPLTLAIIQGLLVRVGTEVYSLPIVSVIESQRIDVSELRTIDNYEVMTVREEVISVLRLSRLFNIKTDSTKQHAFIVIVGTVDKKLGIMVDALIGEEDVVIKPLTNQFVSSPGIAGASILGDGSVSLIIDVGQLISLGIKLELSAREEKSLS